MVKRSIFFVLAFLLIFGNALAETKAKTWEINANDVIVVEGSDVIAVKYGRNPNYVLMDADGNKIADTGYTALRNPYHSAFLKILAEKGKEGVLDVRGNTVVPPEYDDVDILSLKWQVGIILGPGTEKDYEYWSVKSSGTETYTEYYLIDQADFYFEGKPVGSLGKADLKSIGDVFGNYISVKDQQKKYVFYNSALEKSPFEAQYNEEYTIKYENGITVYYHNGTGQKAFMPGCTLTADEVVDPYLYENNVVYDLQGNELFSLPYTLESLHAFHFINGYKLAKFDYDNESRTYKYIIFDDKGSIVMETSDRYMSMDLDPELLQEGYLVARKGNDPVLYGYVDLSGKETFDFIDANTYSESYFLRASNSNPDGSRMLYGPLGQIPGNYQISNSSKKALAVKNADKEMGAVNLYGETIIPFSSDIKEIEFNDAGTLAVVNYSSGKYVVYNFAPAE